LALFHRFGGRTGPLVSKPNFNCCRPLVMTPNSLFFSFLPAVRLFKIRRSTFTMCCYPEPCFSQAVFPFTPRTPPTLFRVLLWNGFPLSRRGYSPTLRVYLSLPLLFVILPVPLILLDPCSPKDRLCHGEAMVSTFPCWMSAACLSFSFHSSFW